MLLRSVVLATGVLSLSACSLNQRDITRIPLYEDSWGCVMASFEARGYEPEATGPVDGKLRVYKALEFVEIEEETHEGNPVLVFRGSTGFFQSAAATASESEATPGQSRQEVVDVARACGPGMIGALGLPPGVAP